jgi:ATP:corrinoid adenosyltransferase
MVDQDKEVLEERHMDVVVGDEVNVVAESSVITVAEAKLRR